MKKQAGFTLIELLVVIAIIGILAGALFPAISGAMLKANMTAVMNKGKKIHQSIQTANIDPNNDCSVWPATAKQSTEDNGTEKFIDMAAQTFGNSTDYFQKVLRLGEDNMEKYRILKGIDADVLSGAGVSSFKGSKLTDAQNMWTIAANVNDSIPDQIPVIITRNVDCTKLKLKYDGKAEELTWSTEFSAPFGDAAFVMVTFGGGAQSFEADKATTKNIYKSNFDITEYKVADNTLTYLTPKGTAQPAQ